MSKRIANILFAAVLVIVAIGLYVTKPAGCDTHMTRICVEN